MGKHLLANKQTSADKLENIRAPSRKHVLADEPGGGRAWDDKLSWQPPLHVFIAPHMA